MKFKTLLVGLACLVLTFAAFAQQSEDQNGTPVNMLVTVESHPQSQAPTLQKEDVMVYQGKQRDVVTSWTPLENHEAGLQIFLLIDDSSSPSDLGANLNELRSFLTSVPGNAEVGIAYMRNGTANIAQALTKDHAQAARAVRLPLGSGAGQASPYFSLQDLIKKWPQSSAAREVIMFTDGIDRYYDHFDLSDPYVNSAIEKAQRASVVVYSIYAAGAGHDGHTLWRVNLGQDYLSETSDATGGESYYLGTGTPVTFTPYLNQISERLKHQYVLTFLAQPGKTGLQPVTLSTEVPHAQLVAARSVYVPAE